MVTKKSAASKAKLVGLVGFGMGALATGLVSAWAATNKGSLSDSALNLQSYNGSAYTGTATVD
eukprot:CAMPEP_0176348186 /NCGR_PEP_ID=MMETSP0126-20121128/7660_1 /TAXON_ID=141414 ORGANISM="Strombidinopsis acuminatum, Strain SPMC142" /NCGR_SAMPLE_ID=MMETSP0126 /ASSEMBLY_ACC=CAM_ASM_000229 /LENGTH=62 /DNA_ID=CAMNT_0017696819 /DNA_START=90 /DNA_END=278 /DNA_ORIENTATION=+